MNGLEKRNGKTVRSRNGEEVELENGRWGMQEGKIAGAM